MHKYADCCGPDHTFMLYTHVASYNQMHIDNYHESSRLYWEKISDRYWKSWRSDVMQAMCGFKSQQGGDYENSLKLTYVHKYIVESLI